MENIVKIRSTNAFSDSDIGKNTNNQGAGTSHFPMNQKHLDFAIPANSGVYDLSNSYMVLNTTFRALPQTADADAINGDKAQLVCFSYDHDGSATAGNGGGVAVVPRGSLVRNIQLYSQNKGMIESLRRQNLLKNVRYNFEKTAREKFDDPYAFNEFLQDSQQVNNTMASNKSQVVVLNTNVNQVIDANGSKDKADTELRIPLHQILDFAKIDEYDTNHYGQTNIHMELAMDKLVEHDLTKDVDLSTQNGFDGANPIGKGDDQNGNPASNFVILSQSIVDPEQECPFHVGQQCTVTSTDSNDGSVNAVDAYITQISHDHGGINQAPPTNSKKITLFFNRNVVSAVANATTITVKSKGTDRLSYDVNFAELVLVRKNNVPNPPKQIEYTAYSIEEDHGNSLTTHKKTYFVEPNAQTLYILATNANQDVPLPTQAINSYRISIDGVDQTGNRDIKLGSALHRERIQRAYDNMGVPYKDSRNAVVLKLTNQETGNAGVLPMSAIVETMPLTEKTKLVEVEIVGAGALEDITLYKQLIKSI
jgi:hypothetical protein